MANYRGISIFVLFWRLYILYIICALLRILIIVTISKNASSDRNSQPAAWVVIQDFSATLGHPNLAIGLEYVADHFQKQKNFKDWTTPFWPSSAATFLCVLQVHIGQHTYCQQPSRGQVFSQYFSFAKEASPIWSVLSAQRHLGSRLQLPEVVMFNIKKF